MTNLPNEISDYINLDYIDIAIEITLFVLVSTRVMLLKRITSESIAGFAFLMVQSLGIILKYPMRSAISVYDLDVARLVFYMLLAFIDLLGVLIIHRLHVALQLGFSTCSHYLIRALQGFALLQVAKLLDRQLGFDMLGMIYKYAVSSVNVSILMVMIFFTIKQIQKQKTFSGIWG